MWWTCFLTLNPVLLCLPVSGFMFQDYGDPTIKTVAEALQLANQNTCSMLRCGNSCTTMTPTGCCNFHWFGELSFKEVKCVTFHN